MLRETKSINSVLISVLAACLTACDSKKVESDVVSTDKSAISVLDKNHLVHDYPPIDPDGNLNVVVEIPAGTNAKWEVEKESGKLEWEIKNGKPRVVSYLGYPGNYGMIPQTLLSKNEGGDGDPLDVLVIGPALPRGEIVKTRAIGVLKLLDGGEQDDKIIAVAVGSKLGELTSIADLKKGFNGAAEIIEIWFSNYKGPGKMESKGFEESLEAKKIIDAAIETYRNKSVQ